MAFEKNTMTNLPGKNLPEGARPPIGFRVPEDMTFLVGEVVHIDTNKWLMDIQLFDNKGRANGIEIAMPYVGPGSYMAMMPQEGSIVILGSQRNFTYPLAYIPKFSAALEGTPLKRWPDDLKLQEKNSYSYRIRKLEQGQLAFSSSEGAELFLGDDVLLDTEGNKISIARDQSSIISTSLNNYVFSSGVWISRGVARRNSLRKTTKAEGEHAYRNPLSDDKVIYDIRPGDNGPFDKYFSEYLVEVDELGPPDLQVNDVNSNKNSTHRNPIAILSLGNFIGNNVDTDSYGRVLGVSLFKGVDDEDGGIQLVPLAGDLYASQGLALTLFKPDRRNPERGALLAIDKEGHYYQYLPAATGGGLGRGRSMSVVAKGNKKEIWGKDSTRGNSWDTKLEGGLRWVIGAHNERDDNPQKDRSMDVRTSSAVYFRYGEAADDAVLDYDTDKEEDVNLKRYGKIEKVGGNERKEVTGTRETIVSGKDRIQIAGLREETVVGACSIDVGTSYNVSVGDMYAEKVMKEKQETYGNRVTTINQGSSELVIDSPKGDISEEISKVGNKILKIKRGNIEETVISGSRVFETRTGNFEARTTKGDIVLDTKSGELSFKTKLGAALMSASRGIDMKTARTSQFKVSTGTVKLVGRTVKTKGVITELSHKDYITGAPLKGSSTVKAT